MTADVHRAELATALELAGWASTRILQPARGVEVKKHIADHVTETDREVEQHVRDVISERFPEHAIVGEEYGGAAAPEGGPTWYLDPVDGTTNYAHGLPWSSFSLAMSDANGPAVAVVSDPYRGQVFSATRSSPAERNGAPIRCSAATDLGGEIVTTEWAGYEPWEGMEALLAGLSARMCAIRIMGSTTLSLVSVAAGRAVASVIGSYHPIDALAATFIAQRAGAIPLAEDGTLTAFPERGGILVAAPGVLDEMRAVWGRG